ncbi:MAG TPA: hypothetical protein VGI50_18520 [Solirubrobacteraceae bacterium]|jgi:hypothetical protein
MSRLPVIGFLVLVAGTVAAFFIVQHLKVSLPLISGVTPPSPPEINPLSGRTCADPVRRKQIGPASHISFYLLHASDRVDVYIVDQTGTRTIATLVRGRFMKASLFPHEVPTFFSWNGRRQSGSIAPDGTYYFDVHLIHQDRTLTISDNSGPLPVRVDTQVHCP